MDRNYMYDIARPSARRQTRSKIVKILLGFADIPTYRVSLASGRLRSRRIVPSQHPAKSIFASSGALSSRTQPEQRHGVTLKERSGWRDAEIDCI
ncbi:hypothetical protein KCP78_03560 [Salmonella enterica subsp. enterica]|nr:hypothetical protein KCP78_03560 [Salmonella enterica subsp. enterica]